MLIIGFIVEKLHGAISPYYKFQPFMTRTEVYKVAVTHYFNPKKSQEILKYRPVVSWREGQKRLVNFWIQFEKDRRAREGPSSHAVYLYVMIPLLLLLICKFLGLV